MDCQDIHRNLLREYARELCVHQLSIHQARQTRKHNKVQRYVNSSQGRYAFSRLMCLATFNDTYLTRADVARELHMTRAAATKMVDECLAENWILENDARAVRAASDFMDNHFDYVNLHLEVMLSELTEKYQNVTNFRKIMHTQLTLSEGPETVTQQTGGRH
ncbi:MAG: hypothetical protein ACO3LD_10130 [Luminiphilus sp.]